MARIAGCGGPEGSQDAGGAAFPLVAEMGPTAEPSTPFDFVPSPASVAKIAGCGGPEGSQGAGGAGFLQVAKMGAIAKPSTPFDFVPGPASGDKIAGYGRLLARIELLSLGLQLAIKSPSQMV